MKSLRRRNQKIFRVFLALSILLGMLLAQVTAWSQVYAQASDTPTPTETRFKISNDGQGFCGPDLAKLYLKLQYQVIEATRSVKGVLCGRLVIIQDEKTHKDYLGFVPCNRGGGPYIFETRPRELLGYYQLVNVKFKNGKKIYSKEFGELKKYISTFETYYPLEQCSKCGSISAPIAPPGFIFPGQNPTTTPIPPLAAAVFPSSGLLGVDPNYLSQDMEFAFPSQPPPAENELNDPASTPASLPLSEVIQAPASQLVQTDIPAATLTPTPVILPTSTPTNSKVIGPIGNIKPPTDDPLLSALGYSLYAFLLIPLIVLLIIWRRSRLA